MQGPQRLQSLRIRIHYQSQIQIQNTTQAIRISVITSKTWVVSVISVQYHTLQRKSGNMQQVLFEYPLSMYPLYPTALSYAMSCGVVSHNLDLILNCKTQRHFTDIK